jgi:protein-S-isoprenylcysteine O-methyltransferase Ste14
MIEGIVFVLGSIFLVVVSRRSLLHPRSHGFYRFFAWEGLLVLFLLVWRDWFADPFSLPHLISWAFLIIAAALVILGVQLLRRKGEPDAARNDAPMIGFEKTTRLVTAGIYRYIRHPLYSSLLFLGWGMFFKRIGADTLVVAILITIFLVLTVRMEEAEDIRFFGEQYREYRRRTRMFVPFLF